MRESSVVRVTVPRTNRDRARDAWIRSRARGVCIFAVLAGCSESLGSAPLTPPSATGDATPRATPVRPSTEVIETVATVDALVMGPSHACVNRSGQALCWGNNDREQLGDPRVGAAVRPVRGPDLEGVVEVSAGARGTCALLRTGSVACWGESDPHPRVVAGIDDAVEVSLGWSSSDRGNCARRRNGRVACWSPTHLEGPLQELLLTDVVAVLGECAVSRSGQQRCFEPVQRGKRGVRVPPVRMGRPDLPPHKITAAQIRAARKLARQHTAMPCVLRSDGTVGCWKPDSRVPHLDPRPGNDGLLTITGISDAVQIAAGRDFVCGLNSTGRLACVLGQYAKTPEVVLAADLDAIDDAVQVVAGEAHACARRTSGAVVCWGANAAGQLAAGSTEPQRRIVEVPGIDAVQITGGQFHTCALTKDGEVWCWGLGESGQLGDRITPRLPRDFATPVVGIPKLAEVVVTGSRTCGRGIDGSVWCWGDDARQVAQPSCRPGRDGPEGEMQCIEAGGGGGCGGSRFGSLLDLARPRRLAVETLSDLAGWGREIVGLDRNDSIIVFESISSCAEDVHAARAAPRVLATVSDAAAISAGASLCVRTHAGALQCAAAQQSDARPETLSFTPVVGLHDVVDVAIGFAHACALRKNGTVSCWGENPTGQLGNGARGDEPVPVDVVDITDAVEITAGWFHTCARRSNGSVWCWGENEGGALGDGSTVDGLRPRPVDGLVDVRSVAAHDWRTCAWHDESRVSCWGTVVNGGPLHPLTSPSEVLRLPPSPPSAP